MTNILYEGDAHIPEDRQNFVIQLIGRSFKDHPLAFRQYIDNAKDSIIKRAKYDPNFSEDDKKIHVEVDLDNSTVRIIDFGTGIEPVDPIYKTPKNNEIVVEGGVKIPYINSFKNMAKNLLNSIKRFEKDQSGQNASGMLGFIKLGCKKVKFVAKCHSDGKTYTYTLTDDAKFTIEEGGEKKFDNYGVEIILEKINGKVFKNYFNINRLENFIRKTYHQDILRGDVKITLNFLSNKKRKRAPFLEIKPLEIAGDPLDVTQIKTKKGEKINFDIRVNQKPRQNPFVLINNRGTGGILATEVLSNPIWSNDYIQGFISVDFLEFEGNDKSNFIYDDNLEDFVEAIEEKVEPMLMEKINKIKRKEADARKEKLLENLKYALNRALKARNINIFGTVDRTKKCPQCEKVLAYNQQTCPDCGFKFPEHLKKCKFCKALIPSASKICPECKEKLFEEINCPNCNELIPKLSFVCPECEHQLRDRKEPKGKSPDISEQSLGEGGPRSAYDSDGDKIEVIKINIDHEDYKKSMENNFQEFYFLPLISKEIAKFQSSEEDTDYGEEMNGILFSMFTELKNIGAIVYKEKL